MWASTSSASRSRRLSAGLTRALAMSAPTLEQACQILLQNDAATFKSATETLFTILKNLTSHPEEPKYRSLSRSGAAFSQKLGTAKGAVR